MSRTSILSLIFAAFLVLQGCGSKEDATLADRAAITDQLARYAQSWDRKDAKAVVALLTEDATFEWEFLLAEEQPPLVTGREAILQYARHAHETRLEGRQSRHHFSGLVFEELTPTEALTENIFEVTHHVPGQTPVVIATGLYRINWVKTDEGWRMAYRKLLVDR
ncbi:MAG: nuclear transport factor 2 family protein [Parvularculaceae bacterium]|nr:nuclear transport factor 2 family protein [Parvularculaceae bacterium]